MECQFDEYNDVVNITTVVHHNREFMHKAGLESIDIEVHYYAKDEHISYLKEHGRCSQSLELYCNFLRNEPFRYTPSGELIGGWERTDECSCPFVGNCYADIDR